MGRKTFVKSDEGGFKVKPLLPRKGKDDKSNFKNKGGRVNKNDYAGSLLRD